MGPYTVPQAFAWPSGLLIPFCDKNRSEKKSWCCASEQGARACSKGERARERRAWDLVLDAPSSWQGCRHGPNRFETVCSSGKDATPAPTPVCA